LKIVHQIIWPLSIKFFLLGVVLFKAIIYFKESSTRRSAIIGLILLILYVLLRFEFPNEDEIWYMLILTSYFTLAYKFFNRLNTFIHQISMLSFGIYLLHQPYFIKASRLIVNHFNLSYNLALVATFLCATITTSIAVKFLLKNALISKYLLGRS